MLTSIDQFETRAKEILDPVIYDFYAGGAGDELSLHNNKSAYQALKLVPRILCAVNECNTSAHVLGLDLSFPLMGAPVAFQCMAHKEGEIAAAKAFKETGLAYVVSTMATTSLENIAQTNCPCWFQLYCFKDKELNFELIRRAKASGYKALVITVDAPVMAKRERDVRNQFSLPSQFKAANLEAFLSQSLQQKTGGSSIKAFTDTQFNMSCSWQDIVDLKKHCDLPILLKGILRPEDANRAVSEGIDGIIVSNHGGRQLDGVLAPIEALPHIAQKVNKRIPILLDGGIRRGSDMLKALALGADATLIGRPLLWGLAVDGENGVKQVLKILQAEFLEAMILCGYNTLSDIAADSELIFRG